MIRIRRHVDEDIQESDLSLKNGTQTLGSHEICDIVMALPEIDDVHLIIKYEKSVHLVIYNNSSYRPVKFIGQIKFELLPKKDFECKDSLIEFITIRLANTDLSFQTINP